MRTIAISTVKNERDIIELYVRHNLQFVDAMLIVDNGSTDGTRSILANLVSEGLPLVTFEEPDPAYRQSEWMTRLYRNAVRFFDVDYVLPLDADEFLAATDRADFHEALSHIPHGCCGLLAWKTYVWRPEDSGPDPLRAIRFRRRKERPGYKKVVIPAKASYAQELVVKQGSHSIRREGGKKVKHVLLESCAIAHFPVRSADQLKMKILTGWLAYLARDGAQAGADGQGYHWDDIYRRIVDHGLTPLEASRISFNYAQEAELVDPIPPDALVEEAIVTEESERYRDIAPADPLVALARIAEMALRKAPARQRETASTERHAKRRNFWRRWLDRRAARVWGAEIHAELLYLDYPPMRFLWERLAPASVLDLGCGSGGYLEVLRRWGVKEICAVDGFSPSEQLRCPEAFRQHNLEEPLDLGRRFDLVINMEVIEHIDAACDDILLDSIERHARDWILFSAADVGQPGIGHINCRPISHWLEAWEKRGFTPDPFASLAFRSLATFSWLRRNPVVLGRRGTRIPESAFTTEDLLRLGAEPYPWFGQPPGVHEYPLRAPLPPAPA